jgi:ABC-type transport system involved in multi-copper enzyme maturation permease subunit
LVKWFAFSTFCGITVGQEILVLVLTPALVAAVIADERQRKTLHYLMASRLTSSEIVLGKLLVRMLYLLVLIGVSLPVLSLLVLFGGVDPNLVVVACGGTITTAWFLASLSIWVSTIARRVRDAFFISYGLECLWLFSPLIWEIVSNSGWPALASAAHWLAEWAGASSPVEVAKHLFFGFLVTRGGQTLSDTEVISFMMGLQAVFGAVLAVLAAVQLRPVFRRMDGSADTHDRRGLRSWLVSRRRWRLWRRSAPGTRPVLWKELHTGRTRGFTRLVAFVLTVIGGGFLAYYAVWFVAMAITEMLDYGFAAPKRLGWLDYETRIHRMQFQLFLHFVVPVLYLLGILSIAGTAAAAITSEHEEDTWVSLTTTDLTGREIIFGKLLGAFRRGRRFAELVVLLAATAVFAGSIDALSLPLLFIALVVYGWFAAALGLWMSLQLRSTWRAQFLTISSLLLMNVTGQGVLNALSKFGFAPQIWPGFTVIEISKLLLDPPFIQRLASESWPRSWWISSIDDGLAWQSIFTALSIAGYALFATLLTWHALRRFEIVAGRPRRSRRGRLEAVPCGKKAEITAEEPSVAAIAG